MQMIFLNNVRKVGRLVLSRTSCFNCKKCPFAYLTYSGLTAHTHLSFIPKMYWHVVNNMLKIQHCTPTLLWNNHAYEYNTESTTSCLTEKLWLHRRLALPWSPGLCRGSTHWFPTSAMNHCICLRLLMHFSVNHSVLYNIAQVVGMSLKSLCV
jgi:hypothetical protein